MSSPACGVQTLKRCPVFGPTYFMLTRSLRKTLIIHRRTQDLTQEETPVHGRLRTRPHLHTVVASLKQSDKGLISEDSMVLIVAQPMWGKISTLHRREAHQTQEHQHHILFLNYQNISQDDQRGFLLCRRTPANVEIKDVLMNNAKMMDASLDRRRST